MPYADLFHYRDVTFHGLTGDARSTQIYFQSIHVSS